MMEVLPLLIGCILGSTAGMFLGYGAYLAWLKLTGKGDK